MGYFIVSFFSKYVDINGDMIINKNIKNILNNRLGGIIDNITVLLLLFSANNLLTEVDRDIVDNVINKLKVGSTNIYRDTPLVPIFLESTILIIIENILVKNPPIIKIKVDLINLLFIIKYMFKSKHLEILLIIGFIFLTLF